MTSRRLLHKFIGPQYMETVIDPEVGSVAREVISKYTAEEVYTSRDAIQSQVRAGTQKSLGANLDKLVQPEATEQPDPNRYNDFLQGSIQILDILVLSIELRLRPNLPLPQSLPPLRPLQMDICRARWRRANRSASVSSTVHGGGKRRVVTDQLVSVFDY
jgi:regulator of protease activity HflC (stomatin/prohibitin superfamily)